MGQSRALPPVNCGWQGSVSPSLSPAPAPEPTLVLAAFVPQTRIPGGAWQKGTMSFPRPRAGSRRLLICSSIRCHRCHRRGRERGRWEPGSAARSDPCSSPAPPAAGPANAAAPPGPGRGSCRNPGGSRRGTARKKPARVVRVT